MALEMLREYNQAFVQVRELGVFERRDNGDRWSVSVRPHFHGGGSIRVFQELVNPEQELSRGDFLRAWVDLTHGVGNDEKVTGRNTNLEVTVIVYGLGEVKIERQEDDGKVWESQVFPVGSISKHLWDVWNIVEGENGGFDLERRQEVPDGVEPQTHKEEMVNVTQQAMGLAKELVDVVLVLAACDESAHA